MNSRAPSLCLLYLCALVVGCADKPLAPIEDRNSPGVARVDERYVVLRGDTLFSIAFRYGLDFQRLAAANRITAPYTIFPGQALRLAEAEPPRAVSAAPAVTRKATPVPATTVSRPASTIKAPVPGITKSSPASVAKTPETANVASQRKTVGQQSAPGSAGAIKSNAAVSNWRWPATGTLSRRFEENLHKGVDIKGERGDAVLATASGSVVYAGSGIAGYGLMLIVRHNDEYLSAYGHNDELLVAEGDVVKAGQRIASRGSSGTDSTKLHFEIRRRGKPVDPLKLLPPR